MAGLQSGYSCSYSTATQILTINNPVSTVLNGPATVTFDVGSFANPYSGKPRTGYWIKLSDNSGGITDSSLLASGILLTVQTMTWFEIVNPQLTPMNDPGVVGELNELTITGQISLPFDRGCRIAVSGPSDMPLISSDLKQVSLNGAEI